MDQKQPVNNQILNWESHKDNLQKYQWYSFNRMGELFLYVEFPDNILATIHIYNNASTNNPIIYYSIAKMTLNNPIKYADHFLGYTFTQEVTIEGEKKSLTAAEEYLSGYIHDDDPLKKELKGVASCEWPDIVKPYVQELILNAGKKLNIPIISQEEYITMLEEALKENEKREAVNSLIEEALV